MYSLYDHYDEIECRRLRVKYKDGGTIEGEFFGIESDLASESGQKELSIDTGEAGIIRVVCEDEIEDIEVLSEKRGKWI